ncbi:Hint domain-containing protein [Thalassococcus sp. S3]|uniref:Hint domain-containing protein n=1 Tax=Thalassococcus sp. S3 TaxID=2017482 RepID=UPI001024121A|nr:Hint domain-containing protein [Thalassococcus sp. S3]QBF31284.1 type I secretion protein [Thalassococcus sp. S3]
MPFLYIYSPSDFVTGLPDEQNAQAAGSPTFTLTLLPDANPTLIEVTDDDTVFDEVDGSQVLTSDVTIDGTFYAAGTSINTAYDLINTVSGHKVTSLHFGGDGFQQGAVDGLVSTQPLLPGQSYTFNTERTSHRENNLYDDYVACFTKGTRIRTPFGGRRIETLRSGNLVETLDHGAQPLRWVGQREVEAQGAFAPIRFAPGALGNNRALLVSPEHRMLITDPRLQLLIGTEDALVPAKSLVNGRDVTREEGGTVTYMHLLFDDHEIVFAEGTPSEALLLSDLSLAGLPPDAMAEARALFPDIFAQDVKAARPCLRGYEAELLFAA